MLGEFSTGVEMPEVVAIDIAARQSWIIDAASLRIDRFGFHMVERAAHFIGDVGCGSCGRFDVIEYAEIGVQHKIDHAFAQDDQLVREGQSGDGQLLDLALQQALLGHRVRFEMCETYTTVSIE